MPRDVRALRREHIEAYLEHLATEGIGRKGRVGLRPASAGRQQVRVLAERAADRDDRLTQDEAMRVADRRRLQAARLEPDDREVRRTRDPVELARELAAVGEPDCNRALRRRVALLGYQYSSVWIVPISWPRSRTNPRVDSRSITASIIPGLPHR